MTYQHTLAIDIDAAPDGAFPSLAAATSPHPAGLPAVIRFPAGLPGFETCQGFVLSAASDGGPLQYLASVEGDTVFLVVDPRRVLPVYRCDLSDADRYGLGVTGDDTLLWLAIVTAEQDGTIAVNLRAPVVINPRAMLGRQVVPHECVYPLRHVIVEGQ